MRLWRRGLDPMGNRESRRWCCRDAGSVLMGQDVDVAYLSAVSLSQKLTFSPVSPVFHQGKETTGP